MLDADVMKIIQKKDKEIFQSDLEKVNLPKETLDVIDSIYLQTIGENIKNKVDFIDQLLLVSQKVNTDDFVTIFSNYDSGIFWENNYEFILVFARAVVIVGAIFFTFYCGYNIYKIYKKKSTGDLSGKSGK